MKVKEWIETHPDAALTVGPDAPADAVLDALLAHPDRHDVYVVDASGRPLGRLSRRRLLHLAIAEPRPAHTRRQLMEQVAGGAARELSDTHFPTATPDEDLDDVLHRQVEQEVEDLPVLDPDGVLLGVVNLAAVLREMRRRERSDEEPI